MKKKKNGHIILVTGLLFALFFAILVTVNGFFTFDASRNQAWDSEIETAYTRSYVVAHLITYYKDNPAALMEELVKAKQDQKATLMGPMIFEVSDDGEVITVSYNVDAKLPYDFGDKVIINDWNKKMIYDSGKSDFSHAVDNTVYIRLEDGSAGYWAVLYPVINGDKITELAVTVIDGDVIVKMSAVNCAKIVLYNSLISMLLCFILIEQMYFIVLKPMRGVHDGLRGYVDDLDGDKLISSMENIKSRTEIGRLADDISDLVKRIKQYSTEKTEMIRAQSKLSSELELASEIQASVLPTNFPDSSEQRFDLYATMTPAKEVGGDFYDFFMIDDNHMALVIADTSDKGVPAALFMMNAKTLLHNRMMGGDSPAAALANINAQLCEHNDAVMFITVWVAVVDVLTGHMVSANAGHERPMIMKKKDMKWTIESVPHDPAIAMFMDTEFNEFESVLERGGCLFVYTDGVVESRNESQELYGYDRLMEVLNKNPGDTPANILKNVSESLGEFSGRAEQYDDITMLCFKLI